MAPAEVAAPSCSSCGAVQSRLGKTSCSAGEPTSPPRPGSCPTSTQGEIIGSALAELRGDGPDARLARVAARVEGLGYRQTEDGPQARWTRVEDTVAFARLMGYRKIGIATCLGLLDETSRLVAVLEAQGFEPTSVCCKAGSADKCDVGVADGAKIRPGGFLVFDNVNWYLPSDSRTPHSRSLGDGVKDPQMQAATDVLAAWSCTWLTNGVNDTAIYVRP